MIQEQLIRKYRDCLTGKALVKRTGKEIDAGIEIYENRTSLVVPKLVIKEECKGNGVGKQIMKDLIDYADKNTQIIALTPSNDFGGDKNRLIQFYKRFGFKHNEGIYQSLKFSETMIRYPKLNENTTMKDITCNNCGWSWDKKDSEQHDMYICHKCGNNNLKNENMKDKIKGGLADKLTKKDIANKFQITIEEINEQLKMGVKVEMEHTNDKKLSKEITMDHLSEIPDYYTRLDKMEKEAKEYWKNKTKETINESIREKLMKIRIKYLSKQ